MRCFASPELRSGMRTSRAPVRAERAAKGSQLEGEMRRAKTWWVIAAMGEPLIGEQYHARPRAGHLVGEAHHILS
jgi:hypothetical protein